MSKPSASQASLPRRWLPRRWLSRLLAGIAGSYAFNARWREVNPDLVVGQQALRGAGLDYVPAPSGYGCAAGRAAEPVLRGRAPLFISARFRSGSTLLWNLFRHTPGLTAYYEPLNERQWFRPRQGDEGTDPTHVNVSDYWQEYAGIEGLARDFRSDWTFRDLYMDGLSCDRGLARYLDTLIARAPERPVLQCNRLDFRLAWLRRRFPGAGILVLYRNPREQWLSVLGRTPGTPDQHRRAAGGFQDRFYTLAWARDLCRVFPFLDPAQHEHIYGVHYLLWRLSYLAARRDADLLIAYEDLIADCRGTLGAVFDRFGINGGEVPPGTCDTLLKASVAERWPSYADADWFAAIEADCEDELRRFLGAAGSPVRPGSGA